MSVMIAEIQVHDSGGREGALTGHQNYSLVKFTTDLAKELNRSVAYTPFDPDRVDQPEQPAHASVYGKKTQGVRNKFSKECQWEVEPPESVASKP